MHRWGRLGTKNQVIGPVKQPFQQRLSAVGVKFKADLLVRVSSPKSGRLFRNVFGAKGAQKSQPDNPIALGAEPEGRNPLV